MTILNREDFSENHAANKSSVLVVNLAVCAEGPQICPRPSYSRPGALLLSLVSSPSVFVLMSPLEKGLPQPCHLKQMPPVNLYQNISFIYLFYSIYYYALLHDYMFCFFVHCLSPQQRAQLEGRNLVCLYYSFISSFQPRTK